MEVQLVHLVMSSPQRSSGDRQAPRTGINIISNSNPKNLEQDINVCARNADRIRGGGNDFATSAIHKS